MSAGETTLEVIFAVRRLADVRLKGRHKSVLFALASFRDRDGTIAPSNAQLVEATCESRATVFRALAELEEWGFVSRTHRGRHASSTYALHLPSAADPQTSQRETSQPETSQPATKTSHPETREVSPCDPLRIFSEDPSEDPSGGRPAAAVLRPAFGLTSPSPRRAASLKRKARSPNPDGVGDILGAFRVAFRAKHGRDPVGLGAAPAVRLLKAVNGKVDDAIARVQRGVAEGVTALHHIANDPNRFGAASPAQRARKGDVRAIAQNGVSADVELQGFAP